MRGARFTVGTERLTTETRRNTETHGENGKKRRAGREKAEEENGEEHDLRSGYSMKDKLGDKIHFAATDLSVVFLRASPCSSVPPW
jgi:hypothetical protein